MEPTNNEQTGGSTYEPAVEFALVKLKANEDLDSIRAVIMDRFNLGETELDEVMNLATSQYEHKEKKV
ncbi:hypothetical protein [Spirosoma endophyticum]|uniref:Uncharacterized protein n=1 Tax=Spirosoma endophyticum TaxID=662367 RepID=A0A1I1W1L4_9BACT|nr:hypothetical protein [Spirosoma endophyticum]SFD89015.1 hypothetical protein SAMN05216167_10890 [Spirosoma endophyticum]